MILTILTHNTYWFQGWPPIWGGEEPRAHPRIVDALAALYAALEPDVLCLQEVPDLKTMRRLEEELGMQGFYVPGAMRREYGGAVLVRGMEARFHDLSHVEARPGRPFERACIGLDVQTAGRSLRLLAAHLSSDRYAPGGDGESIRLAELEAAFRGFSAPDAVAGDFNARPGSRVHTSMRQRGYRDAGRGMTAYITGQEPKRRRVDYIWLQKSGVLELEAHRVVSGSDFRLDDMELSDHLPVVVQAIWRKEDDILGGPPPQGGISS